MGAQISIVNRGTTLTGEIRCKGMLIITGVVEGDIYSSKVVIKDRGHVKGDIHAERLIIEEGGLFDGRAHVPPGDKGSLVQAAGKPNGEPDVG